MKLKQTYSIRFGSLKESWDLYRDSICTKFDTFSHMHHEIIDNVHYIKINEPITTNLSELIDINFKMHDVVFYYHDWNPLVTIDTHYRLPLNPLPGIIFDKDIKITLKKTSQGILNPLYIALIKIEKDSIIDYYFTNINKNNYKIHRISKSNDTYVNENFLVINNNASKTIITCCLSAFYSFPASRNIYEHPYAHHIAKRFNVNVISMRENNPYDYASKYGVYGFYPTTNSLKETSDYVEKLINDKLPTTKRIIGCSWCLGVYPTFYICNEIGAGEMFFFDVIIANILKTPNYNASFQLHEKNDILNGIKPRPQVSFDPDYLNVQCFIGGPETDHLMVRNYEQIDCIKHLNNVKVHRVPEEIFTYNDKAPYNILELAMLKNTPIPQFRELLELNN